jgi:hypothetical protein
MHNIRGQGVGYLWEQGSKRTVSGLPHVWHISGSCKCPGCWRGMLETEPMHSTGEFKVALLSSNCSKPAAAPSSICTSYCHCPYLTGQPLLCTLQNLCDDRSIVDAGHPALALDHKGGRVECEDCVIETMLGTAAFFVSVVHQLCRLSAWLLAKTEACWQPDLCIQTSDLLFNANSTFENSAACQPAHRHWVGRLF